MLTVSVFTSPGHRLSTWVLSRCFWNCESDRLGQCHKKHVQSQGQEDPLEEEMATHSSILAWKIPRTKKPGGLPSMRLQKSQTRLSD